MCSSFAETCSFQLIEVWIQAAEIYLSHEGKYHLRTSPKIKICWMGPRRKLIFLLAILWKWLNVRQQQNEVLQRMELGCRHVTTCTISPVGYFTYTPHPQGTAFRRKKVHRLRFTANNITSTTHQMIQDNCNVATSKDYNYYLPNMLSDWFL